MEKTMFKKFCMMQNLRAILNPSNIAPAIEEVVSEFDKAFGSNVQGTLFSDQLSGMSMQRGGKMSSLSQEVRELFLARFSKPNHRAGILAYSVQLYQRLNYHGYTYATSNSSARDSYIMFQPRNASDWRAGSIMQIFCLPSVDGEYREEDTYLYVKEYSRASSDIVPAIFEEFPAALGYLFCSNSTSSIVLRLDEAMGQFCFAETEYGPHVFQAVPLKKVSGFCLGRS